MFYLGLPQRLLIALALSVCITLIAAWALSA